MEPANEKLEFRKEMREFLASPAHEAELFGKRYMKAGDGGLPRELVDAGLRELLVQTDRMTWRAAFAYEGSTFAVAFAYMNGCRDALDVDDWEERYRTRDKLVLERDLRYNEAARDAKRWAFEEVSAGFDREAAEAEYFGPRERFRLVSDHDLERYYIENGDLARDFTEEIGTPRASDDDLLRVSYRPDALGFELRKTFAENLRMNTFLMLETAEWAERAESEGGDIASRCEPNRKIVEALDGLDAKTVKAVFLEDGIEVGHGIELARLRCCACRHAGIDLWKYDFTPSLERDPDPKAFIGIKFRGKWVYRA